MCIHVNIKINVKKDVDIPCHFLSKEMISINNLLYCEKRKNEARDIVLVKASCISIMLYFSEIFENMFFFSIMRHKGNHKC